MIETKVINCEIKNKEDNIYYFQRLGYTVSNCVEQNNGVTITYNRDSNLKNLDKVLEIEKKIRIVEMKADNKHNECMKKHNKNTSKSKFYIILNGVFECGGIFTGIMALFFIAMAIFNISQDNENSATTYIGIIIFLVILAAASIAICLLIKKKIKKLDEEVCFTGYEEEKKEIEALLSESEHLIFD